MGTFLSALSEIAERRPGPGFRTMFPELLIGLMS
jgi:hypothetical protein